MSSYDDATPEVRAATDKMIAEIRQAAMDIATLAAMSAEGVLTEHETKCIRIGIDTGTAATLDWMRQHGMLRGG